MRSIFIFSLILLLTACSPEPKPPHVLMLSIDGMRADYVQKFQPPNLLTFIKNGVQAESMIPAYPTNTFPNHYTIVTGMYPGTHGLVDNSFWSPKHDTVYSMRKRQLVEDGSFYGGKPIWELAQENGLKTASFYWVGTEANINGKFPDYYKIYDGRVPNKNRVDTVLKWFSLPDEFRPRWVSLYFSTVDSKGHDAGPDSDEVRHAVLRVDSMIGRLMAGLNRIDLPINVVITSDHGMYRIDENEQTYTFVSEILADLKDAVWMVGNSGSVQVFPNDSTQTDAIFQRLKQNEKGRYVTYRKGNIPEKWHLNDAPQVAPIFIADVPPHRTIPKPFRHPRPAKTIGVHGYDQDMKEMAAVFYANGPQFKSGLTIKKFKNIHVYPMIADLLDIPITHTIDGDSTVLAPILKRVVE